MKSKPLIKGFQKWLEVENWPCKYSHIANQEPAEIRCDYLLRAPNIWGFTVFQQQHKEFLRMEAILPSVMHPCEVNPNIAPAGLTYFHGRSVDVKME